jgi:CheY-like chemotaxis protein
MKYLLIADDDEQSVLATQAVFETCRDRFELLTVRDGRQAAALLASKTIHLAVIDLKMPGMDGFEVLCFLHNHFPEIPAIVLTSFGSPEIETRPMRTGMLGMLEKPIDPDELIQLISSLLEHRPSRVEHSAAFIATFMQLAEIERNTCLLDIKSRAGEQGLVYLDKGVLCAAVFEKQNAEEALYSMLAMDRVTMTFRRPPFEKLKKNIDRPLTELLMEGIRRREVTVRSTAGENIEDRAFEPDGPVEPHVAQVRAHAVASTSVKGDDTMATIVEVLEKFKVVDGFQAVGAFSPNGEMVAQCNVVGINLAELGSLANDVLLKAQKGTEMMNVGRGQLVHIEAPKAHVICRCLNEATDFAATSSGRAHVHLVLILSKDGNVAMAKMKVSSVIQEVAEFFR